MAKIVKFLSNEFSNLMIQELVLGGEKMTDVWLNILRVHDYFR